MTQYVPLSYVILWSLHPLLETAVAVVMWRRQLHRTFPAFYTFLLWQVIEFSVLFPFFLTGNYELYYFGFWTGMAVDVILGFRIIHEIFLDVFRPYHTLKDLGTVLFKWAALVMLLVSAVVAFSKPTVDAGPIAHAILTLYRSVRLTQCGLILFLLVFSKYLGISWRQRSFGLALGFGAYATAEMGVLVLNIGEYITPTQMNIANLVAFSASILVWLSYMCAKSPAREASVTLMQSHRWEQSLTDLHRPAGADSLIPMFEGMVERAFSRSNVHAARMEEHVADDSEVVLRSESFPFNYSEFPRKVTTKTKDVF